MNRDWFQDVYEFHRKFGCRISTTPTIMPPDVADLRENLEQEEFDEILAAVEARDLPGIADGVVDLIYVLLGRLVSYGIDPRPIWNAVHAANMAKEGGATRGDGKILKPAGWVAPDVAGLIERQKASAS